MQTSDPDNFQWLNFNTHKREKKLKTLNDLRKCNLPI